MKYFHIADCHIGSWRDPRLKDVATELFGQVTERCINEHADFLLIAGDLFHTAIPPLESLRTTVMRLQTLKDNNIPVYIITGSHDFSPSGKTVISILEEAKLVTDVSQATYDETTGKLFLSFVTDPKTGAKITGIGGRRKSLERNYYTILDHESLEREEGYKIFMLHTSINELGHHHMDAQPLSLLPKGFNYYAAGHVHQVSQHQFDEYPLIAYPGPLFPDTFSELEELKGGGYYVVTVDNNITRISFEKLRPFPIESINVKAHGKTPAQITEELLSIKENTGGTLVTIRIEGTLASGRVSDIDFKKIYHQFMTGGALAILRNTAALTSPELIGISATLLSTEETERQLLEAHAKPELLPLTYQKQEKELIRLLMHVFSTEKNEGETIHTYESRITEETDLAFQRASSLRKILPTS